MKGKARHHIYRSMYPLLCKECVLKTFSALGEKMMFEKLRNKIQVNEFQSMTELSKHYVQTPRPEDLAENKIPAEKAKIIEPKSRW